jgi:maleamate amidohydrolase
MTFELAADDPWVKRGYGQARIEPGTRPAVLVIDLQYAFTDPAFEFGGAELIERATVNTARLLETARAASVPVFQTVVAWEGEQDSGLWTIKLPPCARITPTSRWAQVDERVWADSDLLLPKKWPSFYHGTPLHSLLTAAHCDTVIVTGCTTSGCVRATTVFLERLQDACPGGLRRRPGPRRSPVEPARRPPPLRPGHDRRRGDRLPRKRPRAGR